MKARDLQVNDKVSLHGRDYKTVTEVKQFTGRTEYKLEGERSRHRTHSQTELNVKVDRTLPGTGFSK